MAPSPFLQTLAAEVARMQAAHPEREGELARAHALILHGQVLPSADDPHTGQVLSSDAQTTYSVNGTCDCKAGEHGKPCKHIQAWKLYQYIAGKVAGQEAPATLVAPGEPTATPAPTSPAVPLPEAPASVNVHLTISGRQVQLTLRDTDETRLLQRLQTILERYPVIVTAPQAQGQDTRWCAIHNTSMRQTTKEGRSWFSHKVDGRWCKGR
jgi:hypothetical protein